MADNREHQFLVSRFRRLLDQFSHVSLRENQSQIAFTLRDARGLLDVGEEGVALENLCSNLVEFSFPLTPVLLEEIEWLVAQMPGVECHVDFLRELLARSKSSS
jgi:hypothetical protein